MDKASYRSILLSSSIIGAAQIVKIISNLIKMKVVAVILGPAGIGLVGIYQNLVETASSFAALGIGTVGTRQVALANSGQSDTDMARVRRTLLWGTLIQALIGGAAFWLASGYIARFILGDPSRESEVAWLSLGVVLTVGTSSQAALITGMRRVGDLARISIGAAVLGAILGIAIIWLWQTKALVFLVLLIPAVTFLIGIYYVEKIRTAKGGFVPLSVLWHEWRTMITLGVAFMLSGVITTLGHLAVRTLVQQELGLAALGQFQAAWIIGMTYLGFVLGAMGTDFYPRLSAIISDADAANRLVNEQTEVALLLCAPLLLLMLGFAPWIIELLYTPEFSPAGEILRWQLLGDLLKVISYPMAFILLAAGDGRNFIIAEFFGIGCFVIVVYFGQPFMGLISTGVAFLLSYSVYLPLVYWYAKRKTGFKWTKAVKLTAILAILSALAVESAIRLSPLIGAAVALILAAFMLGLAMYRLAEVMHEDSRLFSFYLRIRNRLTSE